MEKKLAVITVLLGAFFMSFNGLLIRLIDVANGFQILFYRSITLALIIYIVATVKRRISLKKFICTFDKWDLRVGLCLSLAFSSYVFSIIYTTVASTLFILATAPLLASLISWILLNEVPKRATISSMILSLLGVFFMVYGGFDSGGHIGNLLAIIAAFSFAMSLVLARKSSKSDVLNGTFIGGVLSGFFGLCIAQFGDYGLSVNLSDLIIMLLMGGLAIGLGITLVYLATPFLSAPEVSVLVLLESLLGPVWVWLFLGYPMSLKELWGGFFVFMAVLSLAYFSSKENHPVNLKKL